MFWGRSSRTRALARADRASAGWVAAVLLLCFSMAPQATAFEAFDGRVQVNGFFESTMRTINANYSEDWDVTQWYQIFMVELELDLIQDTVGPIDLLSAFVRAEVRYDCIYSRGCGMFRSMNAYGDRSKSLPRRLQNAERVTHAGRIRVTDDPNRPTRYSGSDTDPLTNFEDPTLALFANGGGGDGVPPVPDPGESCVDEQGGLCAYFAGGDGVDPNGVPVTDIWPENDNPFREIEIIGDFDDFRWIAPSNHTGAVSPGGPWLPKNFFEENATLAAAPNPFDDRTSSYSLRASAYNSTLISEAADFAVDNPGMELQDDAVALQAAIDTANIAGNAARGSGALPYRPSPLLLHDGAVDLGGMPLGLQATLPGDPRGLFIPSAPLARALNNRSLRDVSQDYNFSESERAWNRGVSQRDEKELKEAYLDIEVFDSRLWIRAGKQQIVWGKTELFRTTDQFNPGDAALASLPSLEESRIALWAVKGTYSFYEVGPLEDVRLELAVNLDDYQQTDFGACGEAYTVNLICGLTFGTFAHGIFGVGLAGIKQPKSPWQSLKGLEVGGRIEWRYDRFSFALVDFYGYDDFPYIEQIATYTRNVDPRTGRPREMVPGSLQFKRDALVDPYTLLPSFTTIEQVGEQGVCLDGSQPACLTPDEALTLGPTAQQLYAFTCASTVGFSASLDPAACALNIFGSKEEFALFTTVAQGIGLLVSGSPATSFAVSFQVVDDNVEGLPINDPITGDFAGGLGGFTLPLVQLREDPGDMEDIVAPDASVRRFNPNTNGQDVDDECFDDSVAPDFPCGGQGGNIISTVAAGNIFADMEGLGGTLNPQQEALLGCGPFWGTHCDDTGIDLLQAEPSVLFMSWPGVEGTTIDNDPQQLWRSNQRSADGSRFLDQPGTRAWYFDPNDSGNVVSHIHDVGPVCTTANFGGTLYGPEGGNDYANGNQDVLPGCRRKWKGTPVEIGSWAPTDRFDADGQPGIDPGWLPNLENLNFYGQDAACARELAQGGAPSSTCQYLEDYLSGDTSVGNELKDPRSWDYVADGDPDFLGVSAYSIIANTLFGGGTLTPDDGTPDFFYKAASPFLNAQPEFDDCDSAQYSQASILAAGGTQFVPCGKGGHPMTGQPWASEIAAVSWNLLVLLVFQDLTAEGGLVDELRQATPECGDIGADPAFCSDYHVVREVMLDPDACSLTTPELCETFRTLMGSVGLQRNVRRAGGNGVHGRRTFVWQSGGEAILAYEKRNVLGFSMDFAEDWSKSNFSMEFTWIEGVPVTQVDQYDGLKKVDNFNLTMSVDRPTFINFLNSNRTFFFNGQFFMGYTAGWEKGMTGEGPWSFLGTLAVSTGYFQDRLTPSIVSVYDFKTQSGALLTGVGYRFTQNFSAAFGMAFFFGKPDFTDEATAGLAPASNRSRLPPDDLYKATREGGLAIVRDRDELWARIRYTF